MKPLYCLKIIFTTFLLLQGISAQQSNRDRRQQPERIIDSLHIHPGMVIGEAGAGRGYFTFHLAQRVAPVGKVFANDIDYTALNKIREKCKTDGVDNIIIVKGFISDPRFPVDSLDMVIMMKAFHHFTKPVKWMENVIPSMKPGALLAIIDTDPEKLDRDTGHFFRKEKVLSIMKKTPFELINVMDFLPEDNIYLFRQKRKK